MDTLVPFLLRKKVRTIPKWPNIGKFLLYTVAALVAGVINGMGLGALIDIISSSPVISPSQVLTVYSILFGFLLFLIDLYPVPKVMGGELPSYYPVEAVEKLKISLTFSFLRHFIFFIILMHVLVVLMSQAVTIPDGALTFVLLMSCYLTNRTFVNLITYEVENGFIITIMGIALVSFSMLLYWFNGFSDLIFLSVMLSFLALFILFTLTEVKRKTKVKKYEMTYRDSLVMRMFSKKEVRLLMSLGFGFKVLGLTLVGFMIVRAGEIPGSYSLMVYLFASPLVLFTYLGLNFFGINNAHFFTHLLRSNNTKGLFQLYSKLMLILGAVDFGIFLIFMLVIGQFTLKGLLFYITLYVLLFCLGFVMSLKTPVIRESFISVDFTKNSSTVSFSAIIVSFVTLGACFAVMYLEYYYLYYPALMGVFIMGFYKWNSSISKAGQIMFKKLKDA